MERDEEPKRGGVLAPREIQVGVCADFVPFSQVVGILLHLHSIVSVGINPVRSLELLKYKFECLHEEEEVEIRLTCVCV